MSLNTTTLSSAIAQSDYFINLTATTGVTAPALPTGPTTYIICENELMVVTQFSGVSGSPVGVARGQNGTKQVAHATSAPVMIFNAGDFGSIYSLGFDLQHPFDASFGQIIGAPVATATTIAPSVWGRNTAFHVTGTTAVATITLPSGVLQTEVTLIFDGAASWTNGGNIAVASASTLTDVAVKFIYDAKTTKWYPSYR